MIKVIKLSKDNIIKMVKVVDITYIMESDDLEVPMDKYLDIGGSYIEGIYTAPTEPEISQISVGSFRRRLTLQEKVALKTSTDPVVQVLSDDLLSSTYVDLKSPEFLSGLDYLVQIELLTADRKLEVTKAGEPTEV